ncbi:MAG: tetratricopeptide repeat protein [Elusimicrobia bacterium]|nr:tetratricopeptide repeat protein [Elusimicrobiota bacterium]
MPDQLTLKGRGRLSTLLRGLVKANLIHHLAHTGSRAAILKIGRAYLPPQDWLPPGPPEPIDGAAARDLERLCGVATAELSEDSPGFAGLREAVRRNPKELWAWVGLGLNYLRLWRPGSFEKARECFEGAVRLKPDWAWGYLLRGEAKRSLLDYSGALADYDLALSRQPNLAWAVAFKARVLFQSRTDARDLKLMDRAVVLAPREGWMRAWRAESLRRLGRLARAEEEFSKGVRLDPLYDQAYGWRAKLLLARGRPRAALASLRRGIALCPDFEKAYRPLIRALRAVGDAAGALRALDKAAALNHRNDWLGNWRVEGAPDDAAAHSALAELDAHIKVHPRDARALAWRGETRAQVGRLEAGLRDLDGALALKRDFAWAHSWRGECLIRLGRVAEARTSLDTAVELDPQYGRAWIWRGRAKALSRDWPGALADFERAAAVKRVEYSWLDAWRGQCLLEVGRPEDALKALDCAILLDPNARVVYAWRGKARHAVGDSRGSREDFLRALDEGSGFPWSLLAAAEETRRRGDAKGACALIGGLIKRQGRDHPWLYLLRYRCRREGLLPGAARDVDLAFRKDAQAGWVFGLGTAPQTPEAGLIADPSFAQRPECAAVYAYRGQQRLARGRPEGLADLEKAVALERSGWILAWLGEAKRKAGRLEEAIRDLGEAARLDPRYDNAYAWRGTALLQRGDAGAALSDLDRALARRPTARAWLDRSRACRRLGDFDGALASLHNAARLNSETGWERPDAEGLRRALRELDEAVRVRPGQAWFTAWRGHVLLEAGRVQEALETLNAALQRGPKMAWAYAWRSEALLKLGSPDEAARDAARAVVLDRNYARAHAAAAQAALSRAKPAAAYAAASRAVRLDPYSARLRLLRAQAALAAGSKARARAGLLRALALCPGYAQAEEALRELDGVPRSGSLEFFVNYACNAKCPFCFNPPDASPELERGLEFGELARRMYAGYAQGYRAIKFIGGEVTIREDLPKILGLAKRIGFSSIQITTNGIRVADEGYARKLVALGADAFRFSIHGHTPELHDRLVAVPGALEKIKRAVAVLKPLGVRLGINYVLNRVNYESLPETLSFFAEELGIEDVIVYFLRYQGFGALPQNKELLKLSMGQAAPFVREAFKRLKAAGRRPPALIHFPPCVLPELEEHMLDWTMDPADCGEGNTSSDRVTLPDGSAGLIHEVTNSGKRQIPACSSCTHRGRCLGVEENYLELFGDAEFKAIAEVAAR